MSARAPSLELIRLSKRFGEFVALDDVSLRVAAGSFHALLGENGAGKSTLVKCVIGYQSASSGDVLLGDAQVQFGSTREAHRHGLGMVYQRFTLVENMSVAENLVLVRDQVPALIDWKHELGELEAFMEKMPFRVPLRAQVHNLAAGQKQKLEILKQLYLRRSLLFLDEPTSVLTPAEADEVLGLLHGMTREGALTVVLITHKFREVTAYADEVSVLRRGKLVGGGAARALGVAELSHMMVGDQPLRRPPARVAHADPPLRLSVRDVRASDADGLPALRGLSLEVRAGEILGMAGVSGNGQRELLEVLAGQRRRTHGAVEVCGAPWNARRAQIRERKVRVIPEVPLDNACVPAMSVSENLALRDYDLPPIRRSGGLISRAALRARAERLMRAFAIKAPSASSPVRDLSGGNIQRVVLARELSQACDLLIAANPCFGLDFSAAAEIRAQLVDARNQGSAVLLISEDLDELLELSDRLCVMFEGAISFETSPAQSSAQEIGRFMAGQAASGLAQRAQKPS